MSIEQLVSDTRPISVSFEFSPPKTPEAEQDLWKAICRLEPLQPDFVSVTYGAGGSTRERTYAMVKRIAEERALKPAAHLTCVSHSRHEIEEMVRSYWASGVRHIVALRGDMPDMVGPYRPHELGFSSTPELIEGIRRIAPFEISVSFYPEKHPDSPSLEHDITLLKQKVDAGATRALGQFCFDTDTISRFRDKAAAAGIDVSIIPGIMPTTAFRGVERMAARCGASIPAWLTRAYEGLDDDLETRRVVASALLAEQVHQLRARGFSKFHFYTLNQPGLTYAACRMMGVRPTGPGVGSAASLPVHRSELLDAHGAGSPGVPRARSGSA
jgi:methylenetetrahydrofolate reductase (NADPH)